MPNGLPWERYRWPNGLEAYLVVRKDAPVFTFQAWYRVGARDEKLDPRLRRTGLAHFFEHLMFRGTPSHPEGELDAILTRSGVSDENATTWLDRTNYYESLPAGKLPLVLELESDRLANVTLTQEVFDAERGAVLGELHLGRDDPETVASERLYAKAFDTHPYRHPTIGTEEEIRGFTLEDARYFYRTYYAPNNLTLLIVGDVEPAGAVAAITERYGALAAQPIPRPEAPAEAEPEAERRDELRHGQLERPRLLVGYRTPGVRHEDLAALWIAQAALTEGEGAALRAEWVDSGLGVELDGSLDQFRDPGLLTLAVSATETSRERVDALLRRLDAVIARLAAGITDREVERARNQMLLGVYGAWDENGALASWMGEALASAGDPLYAFELANRVERATVAQVAGVIARYLLPARRSVIVGWPGE